MENFKEKMQKSGMDTCNRWGIYEVALDGPKEGNPFTEQRVTGTFHSINETVSCDGFYDGDGITVFVLCHPLRESIPIRFRPHLAKNMKAILQL